MQPSRPFRILAGLRRFRPTLFAMGAIALLSPGCSSEDECSSGETRCDGRRILGCPTDYITSREFGVPAGDCGAAQCVNTGLTGNRTAVCSTSGVPDERCAGKDGPICLDATTYLNCRAGYSTGEASCACVLDSFKDLAFCALEPTKDPKCSGESTCDGSTILECRDGYAVRRTPCEGEAPLCVRQENAAKKNAFCAKEAACSEEDGTTCSKDKSHAEGCLSGHVVFSACPSGKRCSVYDIGGSHEVRCITD